MVLSLHKQPFVTTHFQFITAHFVRHCALKNALPIGRPFGTESLSQPISIEILDNLLCGSTVGYPSDSLASCFVSFLHACAVL